MSTLLLLLWAMHSPSFEWMRHCCGQRDCLQASVIIVAFGKAETIVSINGSLLSLDPGKVRESEDGHTYWCGIDVRGEVTPANTRCAFYTVGG